MSHDEKRERQNPTAFNSADPPRNFSMSVDERIRALTIGVPAWAARKRLIEDTEEKLVGVLVRLRDALLAKGETREAVEEIVRAKARTLDLRKLNESIRAHNRYYPIEANLAIDRATGGYLVYGRLWHPETEWTPERLVARALGGRDP